MSVGRGVLHVVVVEMGVFEVVGGGVALMHVVEVVVVDCRLGDEVLGPADAESFVVVAEDGVGYCEVVCVFAAVD